MIRWWGSGRAAGGGSVPCDAARQAISTGLDGEQPGLGGRDLESHLAQCPACRRFRTGSAALARPGRLETARPAPDALKVLLAAEWDQAVGSMLPVSPGRKSKAPVPRWRRGVQWAGALAPAAIVVIAVPMGVLSSPRPQPTHVSTPCTVHLRPDGKPPAAPALDSFTVPGRWMS
ncbi:MAG: zf-HC2 domain-containing protein [Acidimicrobiales bacterium]